MHLRRLSARGNEEWHGISCRQSFVSASTDNTSPPWCLSIVWGIWATFITLHCCSYVNHHYHPPLLQLCEPSLSPIIVLLMWTIIITFHCFSYVDHLPSSLAAYLSLHLCQKIVGYCRFDSNMPWRHPTDMIEHRSMRTHVDINSHNSKNLLCS